MGVDASIDTAISRLMHTDESAEEHPVYMKKTLIFISRLNKIKRHDTGNKYARALYRSNEK